MNTVKLGDHVTFLSGFAFKSRLFNDEGVGLPVIRIRDVVRGHSETFYDGEYDEKYLISKGDHLIGMDGEFNIACWQSGKALLNQRVCKIDETSERVNREYLARFLGVALKKIENTTPFVTVKHLSVKKLNEIELPLPPLEQQKRIAAILDGADALRVKRREGLELLDDLLQSTFLEMFGDPVTNPKGWDLCTLADVTKRVTDGTHQSPEWSESGIPFLFVSNIRDRKIDFDTSKFISESEWKRLTERCPIEPGDLLYTTVGSYGNPAVVKRGVRRFAFQRHIAHIKPDNKLIDSRFLEIMLDSPIGRYQADRLARGAAQKTLNLRELKSFKIFLPPLKEQHYFTTIIESVEKQKARLRAHLEELDSLFGSLQQRAFSGEL